MTIKLTADNFNDEVIGSEGYLLVDFWAEWCGPCKVMGPILDEVHDADVVPVAKLNVDEAPALSAMYEIRSIPTLMLFKDGQPVTTFVGAMPKRKLLDALASWMNDE